MTMWSSLHNSEYGELIFQITLSCEYKTVRDWLEIYPVELFISLDVTRDLIDLLKLLDLL